MPRTNPPYTTVINGFYHFQRRIPRSVQHHYPAGQQFVREYLQTKNPTEAASRARVINGELEAHWRDLEKDPAAREFAAWKAERAERDRDPEAPTVADEVGQAILKWAETRGLSPDDLEDAEGKLDRFVMQRDAEGELLLKRLDAAQGRRSWVAAGEEWLANSTLKDDTKKLYRSKFKRADELLPPPGMVSREQAWAALSKLANNGKGSRSAAEDFKSAVSGLYVFLRGPNRHDPKYQTDLFALDGLQFAAPMRRQPYRRDQLAHLFEGMSGKLRLASLIALYTGMREAEICGAEIDEDLKFFTISRQLAKTQASARRVPIHPHIRDAVSQWSAGGWSKSRLGTAFSNWKTQKGFQREHSFHSFRHTVNSELKRLGVAQEDREAVLGHESKGSENATYLHMEAEQIVPVVGKLDWSDVVR